ncbi:MAG TPA: hypothetical protein VN701_02110 [Candidatus Paceibacterota bacterium]|nr:hypothetical protein [Candidatus Paceibacterota bacterium]
MGQDAEEHYLARIHEAYEGNVSIGNAYLPYKNAPYLIPPLGENIEAFAAKIFHLSVTEVNIAAKFVFPLFVFLLIYALAYSIAPSRMSALFGAACAMLTEQLLSYPTSILKLFQGTIVSGGIYWARPINPEVSITLLFGALLLLWHIASRPREAAFPTFKILGLGLLAGALLYVSPYPWSFLSALLLICCGYFLWKRKMRIAISIFCSGCIALACAVPYAINYFHAHSAEGYGAVADSYGVVSSHAPIFGILLAAFLIIVFFGLPAELRRARWFFAASGLSLAAVLNQQIITGAYLQPGHFHWYITKPLLGLLAGMAIYSFAPRFIPSRRLAVGCFAAGIILLLGYASIGQFNFYQINAPKFAGAQAYAPVLSYIRSSKTQEVVLTTPELSDYIPIYTDADAPADLYASYYLSPAGYVETLKGVEDLLTSSSERVSDLNIMPKLQQLGITMIVVDKDQSADLPTYIKNIFPKPDTIGSRFIIYKVPKVPAL